MSVSEITSTTGMDNGELPEQVEFLNNQLVREHRIKEGAENLLNMELNASLRSQVESELNMARTKIETITKRIDDLSSRHTAHTIKPTSDGLSSMKQFGTHASRSHGDDFRTALSNASGFISTLAVLVNTNATLPTTTPSSSATHNCQESDRKVIETVSKLVDILRRNLRVRYELKIVEVLQAVKPVLGDKYCQASHAAAYRLLRHMLVDSETAKAIVDGGPLDWYIVKGKVVNPR